MEELLTAISDLPPGWRVLILSMLPVSELRVALPLGVMWELSPFAAWCWAVAGNFLPVLPLLILLRAGYRWLLARPRFSSIRRRVESYSFRRQGQVQRYGYWGLLLLVAIPLPGTGVWSGCLIATLLGLEIGPSLAVITLGMLIAGVLVGLVTASVIAAVGLAWGEFILCLLLLAALYLWWRGRKN